MAETEQVHTDTDVKSEPVSQLEAEKDIPVETKEDVKSEEGTGEADAIKTEENGDKNGDSKPSLLEMKIIRQVEYYFGNVNLWRDKFLNEKIKEDDGWVTMECLITFKRLQSLSMDFDEIITALEKSKTGLLEIHEDKRKIRRSPGMPLPDPGDPMLRKESKMKTLHIKGFPTTYTLDDIQDFILSHECQNIFVKMKYYDDRSFKGSIIVELSTLEEAQKFLKNEIKIGDTVLEVLRRDDYYAKKHEKRHAGGKRRNNDDDNNYGKRTKKEGDGEDDEENKEENKEETEPQKSGCVLHFKGCSTETSREDLKELFGEHEQIEWVDFSKGDTQGYVRFVNEGGAKKALDAVKAANEDRLVIKEKECEGKVIEGIEEKNYWILAIEQKKQAAKNRSHNNRGSRFQNNRGRGRKNFKKDRNQEGWRKRRREWEYPKDSENAEEKTKNQRTTFDDDGNAQNDTTNDATVEKKAKVEEKTPVEA